MRSSLRRLIKKDGAFLLEAMIGTAILSIVLVFFATVSVAAFLLMQRAYFETQIAEDVFTRVEGRNFTDSDPAESLQLTKSAAVAGGDVFVRGALENNGTKDIYVKYVIADGTVTGELDELELSAVSPSAKQIFKENFYVVRYRKSKENYSAVFYILKGEK